MKQVILSLALLLLALTALASEDANTTIEKVIDGDSFIINFHGEPATFGLRNIDAPELQQDFGPEAKACFEKMVMGKTVMVTGPTKLRDGTFLADVISGGRNVSISMVWEGCAWPDKTITQFNNRAMFSSLQHAKDVKAGLWADANPERPDLFRRKWEAQQKQLAAEKRQRELEEKRAASKALEDSESIVFTDNEMVAMQHENSHVINSVPQAILKELAERTSKLPPDVRKRMFDNQFSPDDGHHYKLVQIVRSSMYYPSSYRHVSTTHVDNFSHVLVRMRFRAKDKRGSHTLVTIEAAFDADANLIWISG